MLSEQFWGRFHTDNGRTEVVNEIRECGSSKTKLNLLTSEQELNIKQHVYQPREPASTWLLTVRQISNRGKGTLIIDESLNCYSAANRVRQDDFVNGLTLSATPI